MKTYEKVRKLREDNHLNQEQMAEMLHISPSSYAKMERGEVKMQVATIAKLENGGEWKKRNRHSVHNMYLAFYVIFKNLYGNCKFLNVF